MTATFLNVSWPGVSALNASLRNDCQMERKLFTSESVSEGHPDKVCDQISDTILDAYLEGDPDSRVAVECAVKGGTVWVFGEVTSTASVNVQRLVRDRIASIGYREEHGFDPDCGVLVSLVEQSPDIAVGVDGTSGHEQGAGDQGLMFGYACDETEELMPLPIALSHRLLWRLAELRRDGTLPYLRPDAKSQVTIEYADGAPLRCDTALISTQHDPDVAQERIREDLVKHVFGPVLGSWLDDETVIHVNPTGIFVQGGPVADAGLTGRKIIVDTYGGMARHGGGAFSGKDPSKVDRSAAYAARYIARHIVAAGLAQRCEVQLAYAIGLAEPVSVRVDTFGTASVPEDLLAQAVRTVFPLKPADIIRELGLKRPIYAKTAVYGHFGRPDADFPWERLDRLEALRGAIPRS